MKGVILAGGTGSAPPSADADHEQAPAADLRPADGHVRDRGARLGGIDGADARDRRHACRRVLPPARRRARVTGSTAPAVRVPGARGGIAEALGLAERFAGGRPRPRDARRQRLRAVDQAGGRQLSSSRNAARASSSRESRGAGAPAPPGRPRARRRQASSRIVEKPETPPSEFAVTGLYFYDPTVFEFLPTLEPSGARRARDHGRQQLVRRAGRRWSTTCVEGFWGDAGESIDAYYAVNDFVRAERRRTR